MLAALPQSTFEVAAGCLVRGAGNTLTETVARTPFLSP